MHTEWMEVDNLSCPTETMIDGNIFKEQNLKIEKYEKKLKALIQAYKSLLAEKTALEQTLSALSRNEEYYDDVKPGKALGNVVNRIVEENQVLEPSRQLDDSSAPLNCSKEEENQDESYFSKLKIVKTALAIISAEKSKQEAAFTTDRKRLIAEKEEAEEKLRNQIKDNDETRGRYEKMLREVKDYCRKLELDHSVLQTCSAADNFEKVMLEKDRILQSTTKELNDAKLAMSSLQLQAVNSENVAKLKDEISQLKVSHKMALEREHSKADKVRKEFLDVQRTHEDVLEILEGKLTEMTLVICEKEKESSSLREKFRSLEARKSGESDPTSVSHPTDHNIKNYEKKLRSLINILFPEYSGSIVNFDEDKLKNSIHRKCKSEFESLIKELEDAKAQLRNRQTAVKNGACQEPNNHEISNLRQTVSILKDRLQSMQMEHENQLLSQSAKIDELNRSYRALEESHKRLVASIETEYQNRISDMENELIKQRDRMMQILTEKDQELESLRRVYLMNQPGASAMSMTDTVAHSFPQQRASAVRPDSRISFTSLEESYMMSLIEDSLLGDTMIYQASEGTNSPSAFAPADPVPSPMLSYYQKEIARRDLDIQRMRVDLRRLESQLVAAQHDLISKELTNHEIVEKLKDEIRNLETKSARQRDFRRPKSNGDSLELCDNIEYLKNVFQQFIRCTEPRAKLPMIKAICLALKFTQKEIDEVMLCYK